MSEYHMSPGGVLTKYSIEDGHAHLQETQNIGNMLDEFRHQSENINTKAQGRLAARIPLMQYNDWQRDWKRNHADKWEWKTYLASKLNSPDFKHLRNSKL